MAQFIGIDISSILLWNNELWARTQTMGLATWIGIR